MLVPKRKQPQTPQPIRIPCTGPGHMMDVAWAYSDLFGECDMVFDPAQDRWEVVVPAPGQRSLAPQRSNTPAETKQEGRECKAAYVVLWEAIRQCRDSGMRWFDLGGIDPDGNPGVYHFKAGLGGVHFEQPAWQQVNVNNAIGLVIAGAELSWRWLIAIRSYLATR